MKRRESDIDRVVEAIRHHTTRKVVTSPPDAKVELKAQSLDVTIARARHLLRVAASVSAKPDGFSSTTPGNGNPGGGKGGRKLMAIRDEKGDTDLVPTSSTEVAAIDPGRHDDPIALIGNEVWMHLRRIEGALVGLDNALNRADRLQSAAAVPDPPMCWVAQVKYQLPWDLMWEPHRATDFAGYLDTPFDEPRKVCRFVYDFVRRSRALPERADMLAYLEGKAKVRA